MTFDNVTLDVPASVQLTGSFADLIFGPGPVNFRPQGQGITVKGNAGKGNNPNQCDGKFAAFPAN